MNMKLTVAPTIFALLLLLCAAAPAAVSVVLVDGQSLQGNSVTLAEGKVRLLDAEGKAAGTWDVENVASITLDKPPETPDPGDQVGWLQFVGGLVRSTVDAFDGDTFSVTTTDLGPLKLPVACVEAVSFAKAMPDGFPPTGEAASDMLVLSNKDRVSGTLNGLDGATVAFHSDLGDVKLERQRVVAMRIAPVVKRPVKSSPSLRFTLARGGAVELYNVTVTEGKAAGAIFGGPQVTLPLDRVSSIEVIGGRLTYLETLEPKQYEQQSLDLLKWDILRGRNVLGQPIQLRREAGQPAETYQRGLGVHGPCRILYPLDGNYERFIALAGIDESSGRWADVNLVVKVDGKEVFRADHVKWQEPARAVNVPVAGARSLELIVEAGEHFDVQDRVDWADARLLRAKGK